jgi:heterodisulfide reductase subunit A-like polyferredoxin
MTGANMRSVGGRRMHRCKTRHVGQHAQPRQSRHVLQKVAVATDASVRTPVLRGAERSHDADVVVIGSGVGGLSCAALLAKYGYKVSVRPTSLYRSLAL